MQVLLRFSQISRFGLTPWRKKKEKEKNQKNNKKRVTWYFSFLFGIFGFDDFVGVAGKVFEQVLFGGVGIHTYPVFGRQVERLADTVILRFEFVYPFGLAFERHDAVMVDVQKREHVSADIEH